MRVVRIILILAALAAAVVPLPARLVEAWYSRRLYPAVQGVVTSLSNLFPVALLDVAALLLLVVLVLGFWRRMRATGLVRALVSSVVSLATLTSVVLLVFFVLWGLNYRRVPLDEKLEYDRSLVTREAALKLGGHALLEVNMLHAPAHGLDAGGGMRSPSLETAFGAAQRILGSDRLAVPAAIDGMTDPFFLEIIINPDTLPFERPFVMVHEWAHLAGYANEAEANFVAWLSCTEGDAMARYSGWMAIFEHVAASLPRADRTSLTSQLAAGPRHDLQTAAARYAMSSPVVRTAALDVYDRYLRANRVHDGVASYSAVVRLMLGAGLEDGRRPRLR
jgi:Protein of unknown function (DUF3810)